MNAAMAGAEAMFGAAGHAQWLALQSVAASNVMDLPRRRLRAALLLYAAGTRDPLLRPHLPWLRERARATLAAYRALYGRE